MSRPRKRGVGTSGRGLQLTSAFLSSSRRVSLGESSGGGGGGSQSKNSESNSKSGNSKQIAQAVSVPGQDDSSTEIVRSNTAFSRTFSSRAAPSTIAAPMAPSNVVSASVCLDPASGSTTAVSSKSAAGSASVSEGASQIASQVVSRRWEKLWNRLKPLEAASDTEWRNDEELRLLVLRGIPDAHRARWWDAFTANRFGSVEKVSTSGRRKSQFLRSSPANPPPVSNKDSSSSIGSQHGYHFDPAGAAAAASEDPALCTLPIDQEDIGLCPQWQEQRQPHLCDQGEYYHVLVRRLAEDPSSLDGPAAEIAKDLHRTFPDVPYFSTEEGSASLRRVLSAFALHNPTVGYCQGLGLLAGGCLLTMKTEAAAFRIFSRIVDARTAVYSASMLGNQVDTRILNDLIAFEEPEIHAAMQEHPGVSLSNFCSTWLICLYMQNPFSFVDALRLWDIYMFAGSAALYETALAIIRIHRARILQVLSVSLEEFVGFFLRQVGDITDIEVLTQEVGRALQGDRSGATLHHSAQSTTDSGLSPSSASATLMGTPRSAARSLASHTSSVAILQEFHRYDVISEHRKLTAAAAKALLKQGTTFSPGQTQTLWDSYLSPQPWQVFVQGGIRDPQHFREALSAAIFTTVESEGSRGMDGEEVASPSQQLGSAEDGAFHLELDDGDSPENKQEDSGVENVEKSLRSFSIDTNSPSTSSRGLIGLPGPDRWGDWDRNVVFRRLFCVFDHTNHGMINFAAFVRGVERFAGAKGKRFQLAFEFCDFQGTLDDDGTGTVNKHSILRALLALADLYHGCRRPENYEMALAITNLVFSSGELVPENDEITLQQFSEFVVPISPLLVHFFSLG